MSHLYAVGQVLELRSAPRQSNRPGGPCEVVACLPYDKGPALYRIKSWGETNERVVEEPDLAPSSASRDTASAQKSPFSIAISKR